MPPASAASRRFTIFRRANIVDSDGASLARLAEFRIKDRGSGDAKQVLTGSFDNTAILWDAASGKKLHTFQGHTNFVMNVALSRDGKQPWTVSLDGTVRLWDPATGKERCRLYSFDAGKDWLVVTPEGLFDGSAGAWRFVAYRVPGTLTLVDDDATRRLHHRPGLLAELWKGG